jgi:FMN-dependent NADH-azoreductase
MPRLLYIEASPRKTRSESIAVANQFLDAYRAKNPGAEVVTLDLWAQPLPEFHDDVLNAKYAILHGLPHDDAQKAAWQAIVDLAEQFKSADAIAISTPMWNFAVPYKLKHYLDLIMQPGLTFGFDPAKGYFGLVTGKPAVLIAARGGAYQQGNPLQTFDFQASYLEFALRFMGFADVTTVAVEPTLAGPDVTGPAKDAATKAAIAAAHAL